MVCVAFGPGGNIGEADPEAGYHRDTLVVADVQKIDVRAFVAAALEGLDVDGGDCGGVWTKIKRKRAEGDEGDEGGEKHDEGES